MILEDVDRYLGMAQELLDYSKGAISLNLKVIQIGTWLDRLTDHMTEDLAEAKISFSTKIDFARDVIMDEARLRRVVLNVVANPVKAMPQGGNLMIATGESDGSLWLTVSDTGPGIPLATAQGCSSHSLLPSGIPRRGWAWPSPRKWLMGMAAKSASTPAHPVRLTDRDKGRFSR